MAVVDQQDNFSNISWHSDANPHNTEGAGSSSAAQDALAPDSENGTQEGEPQLEQLDPAGLGGEILECTVSEPHKENDGTKDAYVSYLITTNVSMLL
jgi:sorting nexin-4